MNTKRFSFIPHYYFVLVQKFIGGVLGYFFRPDLLVLGEVILNAKLHLRHPTLIMGSSSASRVFHGIGKADMTSKDSRYPQNFPFQQCSSYAFGNAYKTNVNQIIPTAL